MISVGLGAAIRSGCSTVKIVSFSDIPPDVNIRKLQDLKKSKMCQPIFILFYRNHTSNVFISMFDVI